MRFAVLLAVTCATWTAVVSAQEESDDQDPVEGAASLGYLATSGNTDSESVNAGFNLVYTRVVWSHEFDLTAVSSDTNGVKTAEAYTAAYTGRRDIGERAYLFASYNWQSDRFSAYDKQVSETVGYGRRLVVTDAHALNGEIGVGARQAELRDGMEQDEGIVRGLLDYTWTISETTSFTQGLTVESGSSNTSTEAKSELRARLFGDIALVLSYRVKSNSNVVPGSEKTDRFTAISFEYAF